MGNVKEHLVLCPILIAEGVGGQIETARFVELLIHDERLPNISTQYCLK